MANEVKLEVYTLKVRESGNTTDTISLDNFVEGHDFLTFFQGYISSFSHQLELNDNIKRSLKLDSNRLNVNSGKRIISGVIESGDYGYESTIYNTESGEERYKRQVDDTEIKPFYFLISLPSKDDKGYVILQRHGVHGINGIFKAHLTKFFKEQYANLQLDFEAFVSRSLAQAFIDKGSISEFRLTRYNLPSDIADKLGLIGHEEDIMSIEFTIKARRNRFLPLNGKVKKFIENRNARMFSVKELNDLGFDGDHKSKIKVEMGGNKRTVDLSDTGQIRPYYDIDSEVKKDISGHPVFDSIDNIAQELMVELLTETKG
jgi:hypothetical protein